MLMKTIISAADGKTVKKEAVGSQSGEAAGSAASTSAVVDATAAPAVVKAEAESLEE